MSYGVRTVLVVPARPKTLNQRTAKALLEADGGEQTIGGKHVVKMEKAGRRPITLPSNRRRDDPVGPGGRHTEASWHVRPGGTGVVVTSTEFTVRIHDEGQGTLWAEVVELAGCFATGEWQEDLFEAVSEAISVYLDRPVPSATWKPSMTRVEEHRLLIAG